jgi:uncharacterized membrane protein YoaK (UPF0700 family)
MATVTSPVSGRITVAGLLTLTVVTGLIDAVSYLQLGRVFVANMTGNVVFLGFSLYPHSGLSALASIIAVGGFLLGALAGGRLAGWIDRDTRRWLVIALGGEALILGLVAVLAAAGVLPLDGHHAYPTIIVLAAALGLQNSTVRHLGEQDLTTTVLTLTLTGLAADSSVVGGPGARLPRRLGSVAAMLAGAATGALLLRASPTAVFLLAAALVAAVAAAFGAGRTEPSPLTASRKERG